MADGRSRDKAIGLYLSTVENVNTGRMSPLVGVGLCRIGSEADAVLFRAVADLLGLGFEVLGREAADSAGSNAAVEFHRSGAYREISGLDRCVCTIDGSLVGPGRVRTIDVRRWKGSIFEIARNEP